MIIGLFAKTRRTDFAGQFKEVLEWFRSKECVTLVEKEVVESYGLEGVDGVAREEIPRQADALVVFGGDGDIVGIGLSHLIHAARRNLDITVIMVNNMIYGMTGGQVAATTPLKAKTTTTPYGCFERPLDVVRLVVSSGARYAARWTTAHVSQLEEAIRKALTTKGFGFVEFATSDQAQSALKMDGQEFQDRPLKVSLAREQQRSGGGDRDRRGGGGGRRRW